MRNISTKVVGLDPHAVSFVLLVNILLSFIKRKQRIEFLAMVRLGSCQARIIALERLRSHQAIGTVDFKQVITKLFKIMYFIAVKH